LYFAVVVCRCLALENFSSFEL